MSGYLPHTSIIKLESALTAIEKALDGKWNEFQSIVVTGLSGIVPGAIIAHRHAKHLIVVRKDHEVCHGQRVEGAFEWQDDGMKYIIIDDFLFTGRTIHRMLEAHRSDQLPAYVVLYSGQRSFDTKPYSTIVPRGERPWELVPLGAEPHTLFTVKYQEEPCDA